MSSFAKNILVVGGGFGQLPAIIAAQELGFKVVVVDRNADAAGMHLADIAIPIDIIDIEAVVFAAKQYQVCGALTMQSDIGVPTVGAVVDALGLPGNGRAVADRCSNKILMRQSLAQYGVPQPVFAAVSSAQEARRAAQDIGFPCVIKAPDSSGSRGVVKVNTPEEVPAAFAEAMRYTRGQHLLVEEFISGIEIGAQGFSIDGHCVLALVHDDEMSDPPYMVPVAHAFPSSLSPTQLAQADAAVKACVDALGIVSGPSNIDLIVGPDGNSRIIEVGVRIGATCLPELVFHHTGMDWVRAAVQAAIGVDVDLTPTRTQPCAAYILQAPEDGILHGYTAPHKLIDHPDVLEWEVTAQLGEEVARLRKGTDRIGKVVTRGVTRQQAMELARRFRAEMFFDIRPIFSGKG